MNKKITLAIRGAVAVAGLGGVLWFANAMVRAEYAESERPIIGTVISESYENTLVNVLPKKGLFADTPEGLRVESKYNLTIRVDDGRIIGVSVIDAGTVKKESIDALVDVGSRVRFPQGNVREPSPGCGWQSTYEEETYFSSDTQAGTKRADRIIVMDK